jgi:hypothetical protein
VQQVFYNTEYRELGATASDLNDTPEQLVNVTTFVGPSGEPDARRPGTYEVEYTFTDRNGNVGKANRPVTVEARPRESDVPTSALVALNISQSLADTLLQVVAIEDELADLVSGIFPVIVQIYDPDLLSTRYADNIKSGRRPRREQYWVRRDQPGVRTIIVLAARDSGDFRWTTASELQSDLYAAFAQSNGVLSSANNSRVVLTTLRDVDQSEGSDGSSFGTGVIVGVALAVVAASFVIIFFAARWHARQTPKRRSDTHGVQVHAPPTTIYSNPLVDASRSPDHVASRAGLFHMYATPSQDAMDSDGYAKLQAAHSTYGTAEPMHSPERDHRATMYLNPRSKMVQAGDMGGYSSLHSDHEIYKTSEQAGGDTFELAASLPGEYNCVETMGLDFGLTGRRPPALPPRMYAGAAGSDTPLVSTAGEGYTALESDHTLYHEERSGSAYASLEAGHTIYSSGASITGASNA